MIRSWRNSATRCFAEDGKASKFLGLHTDAASELLTVLEAATSFKDLSSLKSVGFHKLGGSRQGQSAMTVNGPWRIYFEFRKGDAYEVEIVDYHRG